MKCGPRRVLPGAVRNSCGGAGGGLLLEADEMRFGLKKLCQAALIAALAAACAKQAKLPVASGKPAALTVATGQQVELDARDSVDPEGKGITGYEWSFKELPTGSKAQIEDPHAAVTRF